MKSLHQFEKILAVLERVLERLKLSRKVLESKGGAEVRIRRASYKRRFVYCKQICILQDPFSG